MQPQQLLPFEALSPQINDNQEADRLLADDLSPKRQNEDAADCPHEIGDNEERENGNRDENLGRY